MNNPRPTHPLEHYRYQPTGGIEVAIKYGRLPKISRAVYDLGVATRKTFEAEARFGAKLAISDTVMHPAAAPNPPAAIPAQPLAWSPEAQAAQAPAANRPTESPEEAQQHDYIAYLAAQAQQIAAENHAEPVAPVSVRPAQPSMPLPPEPTASPSLDAVRERINAMPNAAFNQAAQYGLEI